jgi:hypothetical protein
MIGTRIATNRHVGERKTATPVEVLIRRLLRYPHCVLVVGCDAGLEAGIRGLLVSGRLCRLEGRCR